MFNKLEPRLLPMFFIFEEFRDTLYREVKRDPLSIEFAFEGEVWRFLLPGLDSTFNDSRKGFDSGKPFYDGQLPFSVFLLVWLLSLDSKDELDWKEWDFYPLLSGEISYKCYSSTSSIEWLNLSFSLANTDF